MLRKIDRWIGRHMSAKRWVVFWGAVVAGSVAGIYAAFPSWWSVAFIPTLFVGVMMFVVSDARMRGVHER